MADMKPLGFSMMPIKIEVDPTDGSRKVIAIDTTGHGLGEPEKTLTTRKTNTTGLKEGEVGMMPLGVGRKPLAVKYLGEKSYKETLALADEIIGGHPRGQLIAYARAEGIPPGQILHPKVLNKFFGTKRNKNAHLFELAAADPFAGRNQLHPTSMKRTTGREPYFYGQAKEFPELEALGRAKRAQKEPPPVHPYPGPNVHFWPVNPLSVIWAADAFLLEDAMTGDGSGRLADAYAALLISGKLPSHGILTRNRDATIKLKDKILQAQRGYSLESGVTLSDFPVQKIGKNEFLIASGSMKDSYGESLYPISNAALMGLLLAARIAGTWDSKSERWKGVVQFSLPKVEPRKRKEGGSYDPSMQQELANYLCPIQSGAGTSSVSRNCPGPVFLRKLLVAASDLSRRFDSEITTHGGGGFTSSILGHRKAEDIKNMSRSLGEMPIGFVGPSGPDGRVWLDGKYDIPSPKTAWDEGIILDSSDWYGAEAHLRGLATNRLHMRASLRGKGHAEVRGVSPATEKTLQELYEESLAEGAEDRADFILGMQEELTATNYKDIDERQLDKLESKVWDGIKSKGKKKPPAFTLSLIDPKTPIVSIAFTLYGIDPYDESLLPEYKVLGQIGPYPIAQIRAAIDDIHREQPSPPPREDDAETQFNPLYALRLFLARELNLAAYTDDWGKQAAPIPVSLLATVKVNQKRASAWRHLGLSDPYSEKGSAWKGYGIMLSEIDIPAVSRKRTPSIPKIENVWPTKWKSGRFPASGLYPRKVSKSQYPVLISNLLNVGLNRQGRVGPLPTLPGLFSFRNISQLENYKSALAYEAEKEREKPLSPEELMEKAYYSTIRDGMSGMVGVRRTPEPVRGARQEFAAIGGAKSKARKVGGTWRGTELSRTWMNVFQFASTICKKAKGACKEGKVISRSVDPQGDSPITEAMEVFEVKELFPNVKPGLLRFHPDALNTLKQRLEEELDSTYYTHRASIGELGEGLPEPYLGLLQETAKPNSRYGRNPRKKRRRERRRRNPLRSTDEAIAYLKKGTPQEREEVERELAALGPSEGWPITEENVNTLFPRKGAMKDWNLDARVPTLEDFDLVSRVGRAGPPTPEVLKEMEEESMPFYGKEARRYIGEQAELSLEEMNAILTAQRVKRQSPYTMQPSSAICKNYRHRKLTTYSLPSQVWKAAAERKDVVIWLSPVEGTPRVMTTRRGAHIDCDMVSKDRSKIGELLGRAIQSSLYWVVERKGRRQGNTNIWIGRVGDTHLYRVWSPGEDVSVQRVLHNLKLGTDKAAGNAAQIMSPKQAKAEIDHYNDSIQRLLGYRPKATEEWERVFYPSERGVPPLKGEKKGETETEEGGVDVFEDLYT